MSSSIKLSELDGVHEFNGRLAGVHDGGLAGLFVDALDINSFTGGLGISLSLIICAHTGLEGLTAGGHADVLNADMDAFGNDAVSDALVSDDTDGVLGYVENSSGLAVVELVGHTSLDCTVSNDVDVVALLIGDEVLAQRWHTMLSESLAEEISRASSKTKSVGHFSFKPSKYLI